MIINFSHSFSSFKQYSWDNFIWPYFAIQLCFIVNIPSESIIGIHNIIK